MLANREEDHSNMTNPIPQSQSRKSMIILSRLLLPPLVGNSASALREEEWMSELKRISQDKFADLQALASSNHVVVRGLEAFFGKMRDAKDRIRAEWAQSALAVERGRIKTALKFLADICDKFGNDGYGVTVIKSLDHWPDLGSDIDLYTDANPDDVFNLMRTSFDAQIAPRSWGDCLAGKWNFLVPGLPEAVEIHMGRLGQTGEQVAFASHLAKRSRLAVIGDHRFRIPSASDRLMISTLQRMYRHFYFRLCDIVDSAALVKTGCVDYVDLRSSASNAGIWEGVATYLTIVSDYVEMYRGSSLDLPQFVKASARFGGHEVYYGNGFLRVPILPQSAGLYVSQLSGLLRKRELHNSARLSLLPWLATAAVVGQKLTGSDKGVW
jgi:hypothetical protein